MDVVTFFLKLLNVTLSCSRQIADIYLFVLFPTEYVLFQYGEDKLLHLMPSEQLTTDNVRSRQSKLPTYENRRELERGMEVRLR